MKPPTDEELTEWGSTDWDDSYENPSGGVIERLIQEVRRLREEREDSLSKWNQIAETLAERERYRETLLEARRAVIGNKDDESIEDQQKRFGRCYAVIVEATAHLPLPPLEKKS